jgi:ribosome biogenesis GTPase / thiamine phosphate phosphatase
LSEGIVIRAGRGLYSVQTDTGRILPCRLRGNLKKRFTYSETASHVRRVEKTKKLAETNPIAVGDRVEIEVLESGIEGVIELVLPRRRALVRRSGNERERQTLVANLELAVIVFSAAEPRPDLFKLDRFLVLAEDSELDILILLNKADLADPVELSEALAEYREIDYEIITTSRITGEGIEALRAKLKGRLSAFCGPSGVGKSSLLNSVQPGLRLKVGETSEITHAGRHTTVQAELLTLEIGGWVADTPGLRQVEFWDLLPEDVAFCFPELAPLMGYCKFANCRHRTEPGCAVRAALDEKRVSPRRYQSYLQMTEEPTGRN